MKIIQLIYSLSSGGGERFVVELSNELVERGNEVTICMLLDDSDYRLSFNKQFIAKKVKFHSMKFNSGFSVSKVKKLESYILSENPDIVHCHLNVIPYIFRLAWLNRNIKFFHTLHNIASKASGYNYQYFLNKYFYAKEIIKPVTISKQCQYSYEEFYNLHNAKCINNGCIQVNPSDKFVYVRDEITQLKHKLEAQVFIHVARFNEQKNQQLLIDVFNKLNEEGLEFVLLIVGNGYNTEKGEFLQQQACDKIHFLGEKNNVGDYLLCSDAFCLTSNYEGLPISLLEALSCGVTPICTPVGGIPDVITDGVNGYLSVGISIDTYCHAVKRYIDNPIEKLSLIDFFRNNYSMDVCVQKYEQLYNND